MNNGDISAMYSNNANDLCNKIIPVNKGVGTYNSNSFSIYS